MKIKAGVVISPEETTELPLELLFHILSYLGLRDLLNAKLTNKTWYHLIRNNEEILSKPRAIEYLSSILLEHVPNYSDKIDNSFAKLTVIAQKLNQKTKHPLFSRTRITLREQLRANQLLEIFKRALSSVINDFNSRITGPIFGPLTIKSFILMVLVLSFIAANLRYLLDVKYDENPNYIQTMVWSPYYLIKSQGKVFRNALLIGMAWYFFVALYHNLKNSFQLYADELLETVQQEHHVAKRNEITFPAELLTISWQRDNIFSNKTTQAIQSTDDYEVISNTTLLTR